MHTLYSWKSNIRFKCLVHNLIDIMVCRGQQRFTTFLLDCLREGFGIELLLATLELVLLFVLEVPFEKLTDPKLL